jgi:hypothetical protein
MRPPEGPSHEWRRRGTLIDDWQAYVAFWHRTAGRVRLHWIARHWRRLAGLVLLVDFVVVLVVVRILT